MPPNDPNRPPEIPPPTPETPPQPPDEIPPEEPGIAPEPPDEIPDREPTPEIPQVSPEVEELDDRSG